MLGDRLIVVHGMRRSKLSQYRGAGSGMSMLEYRGRLGKGVREVMVGTADKVPTVTRHC
jgi:hypothetical protein